MEPLHKAWFVVLRVSRNARGAFDRLKWILPRSWRFIVATISLFVTAPVTIAAFQNGASPLALIFPLISLIGLLLLALNALWSVTRGFELEENGDVPEHSQINPAGGNVWFDVGQGFWTDPKAARPAVQHRGKVV